MTVNLVN